MAKLELNTGEQVFTDTRRYTLQGKKVKFPVLSRCLITDQRFIYHNPGKMAPFYLQLGFLLKLMVKGKPVTFALSGLRVSRGKYGLNKKILLLKSEDGQEVLLDNFDKSLNWFQDILNSNGLSLTSTGEEEWIVQK